MIGIVNTSPENAPTMGENTYEVRINEKVICLFTHNRQIKGLAQCFRDAADAVERVEAERIERLMSLVGR